MHPDPSSNSEDDAALVGFGPRPVRASLVEPPHRPASPEGMRALTIGMMVSAAVLAGYILINWPWGGDAERARAPATTMPTSPPVTQALAPVASAARLHRCEKSQQVLYTDQPCPPDAVARPVTLPAPPPRLGVDGATLYRCKGAGAFWSAVHCQHRGARVLSTHTVPARQPLEVQIAFVHQQSVRPAPRPVPATEPVRPLVTLKNPTLTVAVTCQALGEYLADLDAWGRQRLPPLEVDDLRHERQQVRDERTRLRC